MAEVMQSSKKSGLKINNLKTKYSKQRLHFGTSCLSKQVPRIFFSKHCDEALDEEPSFTDDVETLAKRVSLTCYEQITICFHFP